ncbi:MAG: SMP-30/gluconolactonase/LRE family protein [Betaproteobacteria bacterium]|nr:SMP-30/gluconolactonase/LRE family protein [Betaproteobacteria bacterium]
MGKWKTLATGLRFPEGPIILADGSVLVVEIERATLTRIAPDGDKSVVAHLGGGPNGAAIGPDGACYVCNNGGFEWHEEPGLLRPTLQSDHYTGGSIQRVDLLTRDVTTLYGGASGHPLKGPNDIVFDAVGGFWFTDMGKTRERTIDRAGVYYGNPDGSELREVIFPMISANGIGLSPDGSRLYVAETITARLWEFEITGPGAIRSKPWPSPNGGRLVSGSAGYQLFDSLKVERDGNICVATLINGGITVVSPDGRIVEHVPLPDIYATNLCFGGPDMRTAYITLSTTGQLIEMEWPRPGLRLNFC